MARLKITGWRHNLQKITMTQFLRLHFVTDLREARDITKDVICGKQFEFELDDAEKAKVLAAELNEIGAIVEVEE